MQIIHATFASEEGIEAVKLLKTLGIGGEDYKLIESETGDLLIINLAQAEEEIDNILDKLKSRFKFEDSDDRSLMIYTPDTVLSKEKISQDNNGKKAPRETIITYAKENSSLNNQTIFLTLAAAIIATLGLIIDNTAVIVGAMIIAPVFGPIASMAIGIVLGDLKLLFKGLISELIIMSIAILIGAIFAFIIPNISITQALSIRMLPTLPDILIALAAGGAGAYSLITNTKSQQLVGVVVAAALIPVMATIGIGVAIQSREMIIGASLLLFSNFFALLLAIVLVFYAKGLKPQWWYASAAQKMVRNSLVILVISIIVLTLPVSVITYQQMIREEPGDRARNIYRDEFSEHLESRLFALESAENELKLSFYSPIEKNKSDFEPLIDRIKAELGAEYQINLEVIPIYQYQF